jgi:hypothetical protein
MPDLDELLALAAPPTAVPGSSSNDALRILGEASRRRRTAWRPWVVGGTTLALVGGGVAVADQLDLIGPFPWTPDYHQGFTATNGVRCEDAQHIVAPPGVPDDAPYLQALRSALAGIDPSSIDITDKVAQLKYQHEVVGVPYESYDEAGNLIATRVSHDPLPQAEYEAYALFALLIDEAKQRTADAGYAAEVVDPGFLVEGAVNCEDTP